MENIRKIATRFPLLQQIENSTEGRIKKEYSALAIALGILLLTLSTPLGPLLTSTFGVIIPLKETLTILKQVTPKTKELRHLLIFWLVFGLLTALDAYSHWLVGFIPFFYTFKLFFLLWIGPLRFEAGEILYEKGISRIPESYYKFEGAEEAINKAAKVATDVVKEGKEKGLDETLKKMAQHKENEKKDQ